MIGKQTVNTTLAKGHLVKTRSTDRKFLMFHTISVRLIKTVHYSFLTGEDDIARFNSRRYSVHYSTLHNMLHVHALCSRLHVTHAVCRCLVPRTLVDSTCLQHVHATCPCFVSVLHVCAACPCPVLLVRDPCLCCLAIVYNLTLDPTRKIFMEVSTSSGGGGGPGGARWVTGGVF